MARYDRVHRGYYDVKNIINYKNKDDSILSRDDEYRTNIIICDIKYLRISAISILIISLLGLITIGLNRTNCTEDLNFLISCYVIYASLAVIIIFCIFITLYLSLGSGGEM